MIKKAISNKFYRLKKDGQEGYAALDCEVVEKEDYNQEWEARERMGENYALNLPPPPFF